MFRNNNSVPCISHSSRSASLSNGRLFADEVDRVWSEVEEEEKKGGNKPAIFCRKMMKYDASRRACRGCLLLIARVIRWNHLTSNRAECRFGCASRRPDGISRHVLRRVPFADPTRNSRIFSLDFLSTDSAIDNAISSLAMARSKATCH